MSFISKCFICYSDSDTAGLQSVNSHVLPGLLNLPKIFSKKCVSDLPYCATCSRQLTELSELFFELDDLQNRILIGKIQIESKLKEGWRKSKAGAGLNNDHHNALRDEVVKELRSASLMSMLTDKISKHQAAFKQKFCKTVFQSPADQCVSRVGGKPLLLESEAVQPRIDGTTNLTSTNNPTQNSLLEEPTVSHNLRLPVEPEHLVFSTQSGQTCGNVESSLSNSYPTVIRPGITCSLITDESNYDAQAVVTGDPINQFGETSHIKIEYSHEEMEEAVPLGTLFPDGNTVNSSLEIQTYTEPSSRIRRAVPTRRCRKNGKEKSQPNKTSKPVCQECGKWFACALNLRDHVMKQHRGLANFHCHLCGFGLLRQSHLKAHLLSKHTKERNFKCNYCPASYKNQRVLTIHLRKHTGEKPYQCDICNERFMDSTFLRRHEKSRHADGC